MSEIGPAWVSQFPAVDLYADNGPQPDLGNQLNPFLRIDLTLDLSYQATIELSPRTRFQGSIYLTVYDKVGAGSAVIYAGLDFLTSLLKNRAVGGAQLTTPQPLRPVELAGWYGKGVRIPFIFTE